MTTRCFIPVLGKRLRVTSVTECGAVPAPATVDAWLATDGFVTVTLSAEVEDGTEIIVKNAAGALCVNEKQSPSFKRFTAEIEFCGVNPSLLGMVSSVTPYEDYAGNIAGFTQGEGPIEKFFALELWTGLSGQACEPGAESAGGYLLLPFLQAGTLGGITINGDNAVTFSMTGSYTKGGNAWGVGPYLVLDDDGDPAALPTALDDDDHLLLVDTSLSPPPAACDPQPAPALIT
jgi:hypothetical protein